METEGTAVCSTLSLREPLTVSANDILWLRLPVAFGLLHFFGHLYSKEALSLLVSARDLVMSPPFQMTPLP